AVHAEIVRDARKDVFPVGPKVAAPVAVAVHRVCAKARRNELPRAHRARVRAELIEETEPFVAAKQQKRLELGREEARARRIRKRKRRERVEDTVAAHPRAEIGLDAEDRDDHLRRDAEALARRGDLVAVRVPELDARRDALGRQEDAPVLVPWHDALCRPGDRLENPLVDLDALERALDLLCGEAVLRHHALDELDRKSTRLNSSHVKISYAVFCLK